MLFRGAFDLNINLLNTAKCTLDSSWNYCDVTSPFSRIYLITEGKGFIYPNNQKMILEPGFLYLIPGFISCSYTCPASLVQYYVHFTHESNEGLNIFENFPVFFKAEAMFNDQIIFERLIELNPKTELKVYDPAIYQQKTWLNNEENYHSPSQYLESIGIICQLFSRFFDPIKAEANKFSDSRNRFREILKYIIQNIEKEISIAELADKACLSADHFTRTFRKVVGINPLEYINLKRVEKAQLLLVTSNLSLKEIAGRTGFNSSAYFNRVFRKFSGSSPLIYKRKHQEIF